MKNSIKEILLDKGIKPSYQRIKIYEFLLENMIHPTVDIIYSEIIKEIPTLSKTTVYNTLDLFKEKGLVNVISIGGVEAKYDAAIEFHGHLKCDICGLIYDIPVKLENNSIVVPQGFEISSKNFYLHGICKNCNEKN
ncbi:MAG: transcriptional repressor [Candidatus Delongbacteria bacterium]|nr:transcriptional repressor [Candidatus Delongbacteria bacterium]MBN2833897.1 transcriptional repressor [Candidatus Delongbacteria bacterium]